MTPILLLLLLAALSPYSLVLLSMAVIALAGHLVLTAAGLQGMPYHQLVTLLLILLSIPAAALLSGLFLDRFCLIRGRLPLFPRAFYVVAFLVVLRSDALTAYFEAALKAAPASSLAGSVALATAAITNLLFCAAVMSFCAMAILLFAELPARWLNNMSDTRVSITWEGIRPLGVILLAALAINLLIGLCAAELWPTTIAGQIFK